MSNKIFLIIVVLVILAVSLSSENEDGTVARKQVRDANTKRYKKGIPKRNKKKRKQGKRRNNRRKSINRKANRKYRKGERMMSGKCLESAMTVLKRWRQEVTNFLKQKARIEKQTSIATKKSDKSGIFAPIAGKLVDVGGGNKAELSCAGFLDSSGAKQLANLTETLNGCEVSINTACSTENFPKANQTMIDACSVTVDNFIAEAEKCLEISDADTADDACNCWTGDEMTKLSGEVKNCKIAAVGDISKGLKECKSAFSQCRKSEDEGVSVSNLCSQDQDKIKAKAEAYAENFDALVSVISKLSKITGKTQDEYEAFATTAPSPPTTTTTTTTTSGKYIK